MGFLGNLTNIYDSVPIENWVLRSEQKTDEQPSDM
jgi:hypothetical protein